MPDGNLSRRSSSATADLDYYPEPDPPNPEAIAADRRRIRRRTVILAVSSAILMATVAVITISGVIAGSPSDTASAPQPAFGSSWVEASRLQRFCRHTEFETACRLAVTNHEAEIDTDDDDDNGKGPHKLLIVLVAEAVEDAQRAYKKAVEISAGGLDRRTRCAVRDCQELLHYTVREVEGCRSEVRATRLLEWPVKVARLMSALSAAVTYPNTCMDGIADGARGQNWTAEMARTAGSAAEVARNCLAMLAWMADSGSKGRRTMEVEEGRVVWHMARDKADVVVAKDGSGDRRSIGEALKLAGKDRDERFVIYVKEGVYEEDVKVTVEMNYITMYGDGPHRTVVTGSKGFDDGISVYATATFAVSGMAFMARDMGFQNKAGPTKGQAVALRVESDLSVFHNCWIDGYRNTLLAHTHRQFYRECTISGTIDIISGDAAAVYQNCHIVVKHPLAGQKNTITAQARVDQYGTTGFVLQNCTIAAGDDLYPARHQTATYLGRPAKERSRTVIMQSEIGDVVGPEGWSLDGGESEWEKSLYFGEFGNRGRGSDVKVRVKWEGFHVMKEAAEALAFTAGEFIHGKWWLNLTGAPFHTGLM